MTKQDLPERLRNIPGLTMVDGTKRVIMLGPSKMQAFADNLGHLLDVEEDREKEVSGSTTKKTTLRGTQKRPPKCFCA